MAPLSIGRSRSCSIVVESPTVSRHHADLTQVGGGKYRFEDRGSTSGSYRLEDGTWQRFERAELGRDERVRLGDFECTLENLLSQVRQVENRQVENPQVESRASERPPVDSKPAQTVIERDPTTGQIVVRKL